MTAQLYPSDLFRLRRDVRNYGKAADARPELIASAERIAHSVIDQHEKSRRRLTPLIRRSRKSDRRATAAIAGGADHG